MNKNLNDMYNRLDLDMLIEDFENDNNGNTLAYAKEYGINEVIDGFLYHNYEDNFEDEDIEEIINILVNYFNL